MCLLYTHTYSAFGIIHLELILLVSIGVCMLINKFVLQLLPLLVLTFYCYKLYYTLHQYYCRNIKQVKNFIMHQHPSFQNITLVYYFHFIPGGYYIPMQDVIFMIIFFFIQSDILWKNIVVTYYISYLKSGVHLVHHFSSWKEPMRPLYHLFLLIWAVNWFQGKKEV